MPAREDSQRAEFDEASSNLSEGLKTCRAVVRSYRTLLVGDEVPTTETADNDDGQWGETELGANGA